ncbi:glutamine amidotransferase, partial [Pseudonocardia kujensis]|uniref:glutamine amidotransferase n=1 Tax=Pseudonocardia kujensis TaxID=1128675 RepID=UPI0027DEC088
MSGGPGRRVTRSGGRHQPAARIVYSRSEPRGGHVPDSLSSAPLRVLVAGESWIKHTIHMKGFDQFHSTEYEEGAG